MYPTVSVVIPNYNRSELLVKAIQSVLAQSVTVSEILVCDDGSTDDSKQRIIQLQQQYSKIKWLDCGKNGRPSIPRNMGISVAASEWIAFLDNDDTWSTTKLEEQLEVAINENLEIICTNAWRLLQDAKATTKLISLPESVYDFNELLRSNFIVCSSVLLKKSVLNNSIKFPEGKKFKAIEDYALWMELALNHKIKFIEKPLVNYLDTPTQSIRAKQNNEYSMFRRILLRTLGLALIKLKFYKAIQCTSALFRNTFYEFRHHYRLIKAGGNS